MTSTPAAGPSGPAPSASGSDGYPLTYRGREYPVADLPWVPLAVLGVARVLRGGRLG